MKGMGFLKGAAVGVACCGMMLPQDLLAAGPRTEVRTTESAQAPEVTDVALRAGGTLTGQVVDAQGFALEGTVVSIRQGTDEVASTVADSNGTFTARNLRGGVYHVTAGQGEGVFRFWAPNTAPPAARDQALIVSGSETLRGYHGGMGGMEIGHTLTLGTAVTGVVLGSIALARGRRTQTVIIEVPVTP